MPVLRITRRIVDWLIILGMILLTIIRFGMLGNANAPSLHSPIEDWGEVAACFLWLIVPLAATLLAFKRRRWAGYVCFLGLPVAAWIPGSISFWPSLNDPAFWSEDMGAVFTAIGLYWLLTSAFGSPPVLARLRQSSRFRKWALNSGLALACVLGLIWTLLIALATFPAATCKVIPPSPKPRFPNQALFIATDAVSFGKKPAPSDMTMPILDGFAIARVQEHFWGLPWWSRKFILLWRPPQFNGEAYFYDGVRPSGLLTQFLPIVCYDECSRTNFIRDAEIDLRVLKDGPSQTSGRIFGHAFRPMDGPWQWQAGIKVTITGPGGNSVTATDARGLYDAPGLPPGEYSVQIEVPPKSFVDCTSPIKLEPGKIVECDAEVE